MTPELTERLKKLSPEKRGLLMKRLLAEMPHAPIARRTQPGPAPLSFSQQRLWFLNEFAPNSPAYNISAAVRLNGQLRIDVLQRVLTETVRRHESLRTTFALIDRAPVQIVAPPAQVLLPLIDLSGCDDSNTESRRLASLESQRPFNLRTGPLLRFVLMRLSEDQHVALLTLHHIISDGWSAGIFVRELCTLYAAYSENQRSPLEELAIQYADFTVWQREWLEGPVMEMELSYWREQLKDAPPVLNLPTDWPRPPVQTNFGAVHSIMIDAGLLESLHELARTNGVTLFMTLLAAYNILLSRYSGQADVIVGTPTAGRTRLETEPLIGCFINMLALRTAVNDDMRVVDLLQRVRETTLEAFSHQDVPFEKLIEELRPERSMSYSPLFQVVIVLQNAPAQQLRVRDLTFAQFENEVRTAKFDLTLAMTEMKEGLRTIFEYNKELFNRASIARMAQRFVTVLGNMVAAPQQTIASLSLLTSEERAELLDQWSHAERYVVDECLHERFAQQAERTPNARALTFEGKHLTYAELNVEANRLANYLRSRGVGPESRVAICLERSIELVIAVLGVLKAGAAYVPLDPANPVERIAFMLADSAAALLVTQSQIRDRLFNHKDTRTQIVCLDTENFSGENRSNPQTGCTPQNLAYIIYTSGSTGQPKGVMVTHANVVRLFEATACDFEFSSSDVWTLFHSFAFDFSVWELWGALLWGGRLVVVPYEVSRTPAEFAGLLKDEQVTMLSQTPSAFRQLTQHVAQTPDDAPATLRAVVFGGEALEFWTLRDWVERYGVHSPRLINMYGITETCVHVTYRPLHAAEVLDQTGSRIGRAIDDLTLYVLDQRMEPVALGIVGELYVGGAGLARGYLNQPALTADRFVPDPFAKEAGARLYRTGDTGRWISSGEVEYVGRCDQQVKVRGYRIELGEIEAALCEHPKVQAAAVIVRDGNDGHKQLVGYVVTEAPASELRRYLLERLPDHMIPSLIVEIDRLPLTSNGKLNRQALLDRHDELDHNLDGEYVAPRTPSEEIIASVWKEVLGTGRVGMNDNFFVLGGHSISATQVTVRLRRALGVEIPLRMLFESPTVAALAERVEPLRRDACRDVTPLLDHMTRDAELPLSFSQQRLWFLHQLDPSDPSYHVPFAVRLQGKLNIGAFCRSLDEVVRRHEVLRTTFPSVGGRPIQAIWSNAKFELSIVDLSSLIDDSREREMRGLAAEEVRLPFDLARGVLRGKLLRLATDDYALLVTMHHIVSDAWSVGVLVREVATLYTAYLEGRESPLEELPIQYAGYASWQRDWLQDETLEEHLAYWRKQLDGAPPLLEMPTDRPRPLVRTHLGVTHRFTLKPEVTASLKDLSQREGATLYMTLLAGLNVLLARYSGQPDIVVGTSVAGRARLELEPLIGCFVNTLALRTNLSDDPAFRDLIARLRDTCLGAYAHQHIPFEKLVEEVQPKRSMGHTPLFQVMFVLQNAPYEDPVLPDIRLSSLGEGSASAKFDLTLTMAERDGVLFGALEGNAALFDRETIERLTKHFATLLEAAVANPERAITALPLLTTEERQALIAAHNEVEPGYRQAFCLHELFEQQVRHSPDNVALTCNDEKLTYAELNRRANQLAHRLRRHGVEGESRVALLLERSSEMVVAILGVLKAGGCYVPLDPMYPHERLRLMLDDSGAEILVTQRQLHEQFEDCMTHVICVDDDLARESDTDPLVQVTPDNLCYIIYTSGSTGTPKGVAVTHRNVARLFDTSENILHFSSSDVWTLFHSYAFDFSVWELWGPLLHGGRLVVVPYWISRTPEAFRRLLVAECVTILNQTPSAFRQLIEVDAQTGMDHGLSLRAIVFGGEALDPTSLRPWVEKYGESTPALINMYGITETCVHVTYRRMRTEDANGGGASLIGGPLSDLQLYVLDARMELVPIGVVGELYVGGAGLARGYLNAATLTAERFVPDSFSGTAGMRLYRTGDLGRKLIDGDIEYVGRCDQQVKVRGFRIELAEIESVLREHPLVRDVAVVLRRGHQQLVAYVVAKAGYANEGLANELRMHAAGRLPDYMVPSFFVELDHFRLTRNGKLDRDALPDPEPSLEGEFVAPRNPTEEVLAIVWRGVLELDQVGVNDSFFELGGHSLLATQIISQVRDIFDADLPLRSLFETPTISGMRLALIEVTGDMEIVDAIAQTFLELESLSEEEVKQKLLERAAV